MKRSIHFERTYPHAIEKVTTQWGAGPPLRSSDF